MDEQTRLDAIHRLKSVAGHVNGIVKMLDLIHPVYQATAAYGHFGRKPQQVSYTDGAGKNQVATAFSWEMTDRAEALRKDAKLK